MANAKYKKGFSLIRIIVVNRSLLPVFGSLPYLLIYYLHLIQQTTIA